MQQTAGADVAKLLQAAGRVTAREGCSAFIIGGVISFGVKLFVVATTKAGELDGPILRVGDRTVHTFLFALLDDCSRLVPHAQYYDNQKLPSLLDCLKEAFGRRGLPGKLYTDHGKIFTCAHLQVICANLKIKLIHARPYAAWSRGKIERFFRTLTGGFSSEIVASRRTQRVARAKKSRCQSVSAGSRRRAVAF